LGVAKCVTTSRDHTLTLKGMTERYASPE